MSANIKTYGQLENTEKPWWAKSIEKVTTWTKGALWQEVSEKSGLNWEAGFSPVYTQSGRIVQGYRAIVRNDTQDVLGMAKSKYHIVQPADGFKFFDECIGNGVEYFTAGSLGNGNKIWVLAKLPYQSEIVKGDLIENYTLLSNSFDGSTTLKIMFTPIRVVCQNTLKMAEVSGNYLLNARHTESVTTKIKSVRGLLNDLILKAQQTEYDLKAMQKVTISDEEMVNFLNELFAPEKSETEISTRAKNTVQEIMNLTDNGKGTDLPGVKGTVYGLYNAITEYADHFKTVKGEKENPDKRFDSVMFGSSASLKENAFNKALQLV